MDEETTNVDPIEGYCVRCKMSVEMETPEAVWTSRGTPGTRGVCPECGGTVFRMGATHLHDGMERPKAVRVEKKTRRKKPVIPPNTVYVSYAPGDEATAQQIAGDLNKIGLTTWLHEADSEDVNWAGGVHPALKDCSRMVLLLSPGALTDPDVEKTWQFFKEKRKPIVLAQVAPDTDPPDRIRRSPRFDFTGTDYKSAFREMVQALAR